MRLVQVWHSLPDPMPYPLPDSLPDSMPDPFPASIPEPLPDSMPENLSVAMPASIIRDMRLLMQSRGRYVLRLVDDPKHSF